VADLQYRSPQNPLAKGLLPINASAAAQPFAPLDCMKNEVFFLANRRQAMPWKINSKSGL